MTIKVYLKNGKVFEFGEPDASKAESLAHLMVTDCLRLVGTDGTIEYYTTHEIEKVVIISQAKGNTP